MHEVALVKNLIFLLEKEIDSSEIGDVKTVYLEVGQLHYHDHPLDIIENCFEHLPKSEKLSHAKIDVTILPVKVKCSDCAKENVVKESELQCSSCLSRNVDIISGNEFNIKGIEW